MAFPLALIGKASALWSTSKWLILAAALAFSHYYAYQKGIVSVYKADREDIPTQVVKEAKRGVEAVRRASVDTSRIRELEQQNEKLLTNLEEMSDRTLCSYSPDELRIVEEAVAKTKRD